MKNNFYLFLALIGFGVIILSCNDDDTNSTVMVNPTLDLQMRVGSETLTAGNIYDINGTALQVNVAQFYIGDISLTGAETVASEDFFVIGTALNNISLPETEVGSYDLSFGVGVNAAINALPEEDFTTRPTGDPLGMQEPSMHWNWNAGYKFLRIDGNVDTDADGVPDQAVEYHLGNDAFYAILNSPNQVSLSEADASITLRFDLAALFSGADLSTGEVTHVGDNPDLADLMLANYTEAFSIIF